MSSLTFEEEKGHEFDFFDECTDLADLEDGSPIDEFEGATEQDLLDEGLTIEDAFRGRSDTDLIDEYFTLQDVNEFEPNYRMSKHLNELGSYLVKSKIVVSIAKGFWTCANCGFENDGGSHCEQCHLSYSDHLDMRC